MGIPGLRQIADGSGHGDIDLVLARTRLRAIANAAEPLPLVGARRNENDLRACFCQNACRLRKFDVITYEDRNPAVIGVIDVETMSGAHLIRALLRLRETHLLLPEDSAVGSKQVGGIGKLALLNHGMSARNNIQPASLASRLNVFRIQG